MFILCAWLLITLWGYSPSNLCFGCIAILNCFCWLWILNEMTTKWQLRLLELCSSSVCAAHLRASYRHVLTCPSYKRSSKMILPAFWAKQRRKTFQLCSGAPYSSHTEHAGTKPSDPALLLDRSQLSQIGKAWLVLTRAWVCMLCER